MARERVRDCPLDPFFASFNAQTIMRIVLISQYYWPETFGAGKWTAEIAEWLAQRGHHVTVVTAFPNYPEGVIHPEYRGRVVQREEHNGVHIIRTWIYATPRTKNIWQRVLGQASFSISLLMATMMLRRPEVIWYASPPLPGAVTAWVVAWLNRAKYALFLSDLEPERSIALGLFKNRHLIKLLQAIERFAYKHADRVCVLSESTRQWLIEKGVEKTKLVVTPLWADGNQLSTETTEISMRPELGLNGEFVALYSGNMGYTMVDLATVVDAARILAADRSIHFLIAGDGVRRDGTVKHADGLPNITFLPIQPLSAFPRLLATADVGIVLLSREGTRASVPSKTYSLLGAGKAIVALCEGDSDTFRLLREAQCGSPVAPGDAQQLAKVLQDYKGTPGRAKTEGIRGREYFERNHTPQVAMPVWEDCLSQLGRT
jgi:colanic acid biosynthesis glycosyl transferase WcaI